MSYYVPDDAVCAECFDDDYLKSQINACASVMHCDYCGRRSRKKPTSVSVSEIVKWIRDGLESEYGDAADQGVPYESAEGGYQFPTMSTEEVLDEIGFCVENDELFRRIVSLLPDHAWIQLHPFSLSPTDSLCIGWDRFCHIVKHRVRYLLFPPRNNNEMKDEVRPEEMLDALGRIVASFNLTSTLTSGTRLYRAITHRQGQHLNDSLDLGPPPSSAARYANRMNPAGISMFYAALDKNTAIAETPMRNGKDDVEVTIAVFELVENLLILNLMQIPEVPSIFADEDERWKRPGLIFLHHFLEDFTKPVVQDGREHIDYVPTQIVTEYFRHRFEDAEKHPVRGILYPSSKNSGGKACVLFVSYEDCAGDWTFGEPTKPPFRLVSKRMRATGLH